DIVAENNDPEGTGLTAILDDVLFSCQEIPFMAIDNEGSSKKKNRKYYYVLHLYSSLINGQKVVVTLLGIQVFFDILVSDGKPSDDCEIKSILKLFLFAVIIQKKTYLQIYTSGTGKRKTVMKAIQDNNYETASDDLYSFYRKVARENGIQLCGWSILNFWPVADLKIISNQFPISVLLQNRILVLAWNIKMQSRELGDFAEALDLNQNIFIF
ncbi:20000_t:CDS:2, partial [Funneliformis geosporum]